MIDEKTFDELEPPEDGRVVINKNGTVIMSMHSLKKILETRAAKGKRIFKKIKRIHENRD